MDISKIDKNFSVKTNIKRDGMVFHSAEESGFKVYGIFRENGRYTRMPEAAAKSVSDGVYALHGNSSGGRLRFKTDSPYVALSAVLEKDNVGKMPHFAFTGSIGFDMYTREDGGWIYAGTVIPPVDVEDRFEGIIDFGGAEEREILIHFPLYSTVREVYIGIDNKAVIKPPTPYAVDKPIVFYGSSITQGGCASRPGNSFSNIVSRTLDADHINLGFSGSACGEREIAEYISKIPMSAFIYDYDHNAPTVEHLAATHEKTFKTIRKSNPDVPIVMLTRPKVHLTCDEIKRMETVKETYVKAKNEGDKNVYFIAGNELIQSKYAEFATVDNTHPNDIGFFSMAEVLCGLLKKII